MLRWTLLQGALSLLLQGALSLLTQGHMTPADQGGSIYHGRMKRHFGMEHVKCARKRSVHLFPADEAVVTFSHGKRRWSPGFQPPRAGAMPKEGWMMPQEGCQKCLCTCHLCITNLAVTVGAQSIIFCRLMIQSKEFLCGSIIWCKYLHNATLD